MKLKTTLEQWHTLIEIEKCGSIQSASIQLNKSHTTLIYAVKKLEAQLGIDLIQIKNRRAVVTEHGKSLLRRAIPMLDQARDIELMGIQLTKGVESQINVSIDHLCDRKWLYEPLSTFLSFNSGTSIDIAETSLTSTRNTVINQAADITIVTLPVEGYLAEAFGLVTMVPVVSPNHPLAKKDVVCNDDLLSTTQIVLRDLGQCKENDKADENVGWLKSQRRITVDNFDHAWDTIALGLGFCRLPHHMLQKKLKCEFVQLPLLGSSRYQVPLHITLPKGDKTGIASRQLYELLLDSAKSRMLNTNLYPKL